MKDGRIVASFRKSNSQEVRVSVGVYDGYTLVDARVFAVPRKGGGEPRSTAAGICVAKSNLPALIAALQAAEREVSR